MDDWQMQIIRHGISRTVILVGRWAIKVPTLRPIGAHRGLRGRFRGFAQGYLANLSELTWSTFRPWEGAVAPVLHSWLWSVIQVYPRCEPTIDGLWYRVNDGWVYQGDGRLPTLDPSPGDIKPDNFGWLNGRIVWLDYDMS